MNEQAGPPPAPVINFTPPVLEKSNEPKVLIKKRRKIWPIIAGVLGLLVVIGVAVYTLWGQQLLQQFRGDIRQRASYADCTEQSYNECCGAGLSRSVTRHICPGGTTYTTGSCNQNDNACGPAGGGQTCGAGYQFSNGVCVCVSPNGCGAVPSGGTVNPGTTPTSAASSGGTVCFPGIPGVQSSPEVQCGAEAGCVDGAGRACNSSGTGWGSCTGMHACGYVAQGGECTTSQQCINIGYGSGVSCTFIDGIGWCTGENGRRFSHCGGTNLCQNCYINTDGSDAGCFSEPTSCGQKTICQNQTSTPVPTPTPTTPAGGGGGGGGGGGSTPTPTPTPTTIALVPTPTPTDIPGTTPTPTNTPTPTPTSGPTPTPTATPTPMPSCNSTCVENSDCLSNFICSAGRCRNALCVNSSGCYCVTPTPTKPPTTFAAATPTPRSLPETGISLPTLGAMGGGIIMILLGIILAL